MCGWQSVPIFLVLLVLKSHTREINQLDIVNNHVSRGNRSQRFLFDAIFGLEVPILGEQSVEDDEEEYSGARNCSCECGRANLLPRKLTKVKKNCGGPDQENRIVGGLPAGLNRYPWMARLVYDGQFHCGASLLSKEYVLTAAHCVRKLKRSKIRVILGDHDQTLTTESAAIMRAVTSIVRHRSFDADSYNNDIALLKLRKPVSFSKIIKPVCLPPASIEPAGKEGIVVGWGRTSEGGQLPAVVQEVRVPILSLTQCRGMKYRASRITNNMLCAGRASTDSCQGDSGGPLLIQQGDRYQIVGIVSWGVGCGRPGYPGVYTRITRYLPWINANLRDSCLCAN
ncbi:trypsin-1-like [Aricia agestis]|uniref:trypsin-1-like n=1 Tax=Aricia agestis TaxID=91739 RepID=UPI001C20A6AE|nr:trypsin-1-like [Aricia agestis]